MLYRVQNPTQLAVYHDAVMAACQQLVEETHLEKSAADVYAEILEHFGGPERGVWCVLRDGVLVSFIAAKIYHDEGRRHCCITWAWSESPKDSPECHEAVMQWARDEGCDEVYCARRTRIEAFYRILRPYGWTFESVVFKKSLKEVADGQASVSGIHERDEHPPPLAAVAGESPDESVRGATVGAAPDGGERPAPAVDFQFAVGLAPDAGAPRPRRRARESVERRSGRRLNAPDGARGNGVGPADAGTARTA